MAGSSGEGDPAKQAKQEAKVKKIQILNEGNQRDFAQASFLKLFTHLFDAMTRHNLNRGDVCKFRYKMYQN
ncbi:hypothetical protein P5G65_15230 [Paenibacillus chondroitinus]|uniref:Uncharacterized protein n=1 Tax=Paenibacillus chondroitinus TaxID=59842 RepID=A0ABU6DE85_9BACL|nr:MULTISPECIES: hypothetical protein [Paenibacillus]MCY9656434.1 hypothetical protein [Paenibacillus anseongense]MEB4795258.1 hypothetical protein [Paenibacillus chondroitinus]